MPPRPSTSKFEFLYHGVCTEQFQCSAPSRVCFPHIDLHNSQFSSSRHVWYLDYLAPPVHVVRDKQNHKCSPQYNSYTRYEWNDFWINKCAYMYIGRPLRFILITLSLWGKILLIWRKCCVYLSAVNTSRILNTFLQFKIII